ncbi:MAG TPA: aminomethyltransferase family protein [Pyrinomonadaceae bacterium]|jgi:folate-binding protein YgfZ|nr:aminomethyltransferase family protein [Pyrinomonadaceae bacterium]
MNETVEQLSAQHLALAETHRKHGATFTERDGYMLPAAYGDARAAEYEAVRGGDGAGLVDLSARGRIEVGGAEAVQFLNGLITNDVKTLGAGAWMLAAFPNVQGRLLAHARIARPGEEVSFLIDTEPATHEKVFQTLQRFTLAGDFRVRDVTGETAQFSLQGARAGAIIESVLGGAFTPETARQQQSAAHVSWRETGEQIVVLHATHTGEDGYDLVCASDTVAADLWEALTKAGARPVGFDAFDVLRVEAGEPRHGVDVTDTNVVLEAGQDEAVSYTKGCYIGQEIIARIHWRGHVAKRLAGLVLEDEREPGADAKVRASDGKEIGRITSQVFSPRLARRIALAILKYDYLQPDTQVSVVAGEAELAARVVELPFVRGSWYAAASDAGASGVATGETTT